MKTDDGSSENRTSSDQVEDDGEDDEVMRTRLLARIQERRATIDEFLDRMRPRNSRLATVGLLSSTLSGAFTIGPGIGGDSFSQSVQNTAGLSASSQVWQILCLGSLAMSGIAAFCNNSLRSTNVVTQIAGAEAAYLELDGLATMLEFGDISLETAVKRYQECMSRVPFIQE